MEEEEEQQQQEREGKKAQYCEYKFRICYIICVCLWYAAITCHRTRYLAIYVRLSAIVFLLLLLPLLFVCQPSSIWLSLPPSLSLTSNFIIVCSQFQQNTRHTKSRRDSERVIAGERPAEKSLMPKSSNFQRNSSSTPKCTQTHTNTRTRTPQICWAIFLVAICSNAVVCRLFWPCFSFRFFALGLNLFLTFSPFYCYYLWMLREILREMNWAGEFFFARYRSVVALVYGYLSCHNNQHFDM